MLIEPTQKVGQLKRNLSKIRIIGKFAQTITAVVNSNQNFHNFDDDIQK